jgi:hypothetical protein
MRSGINAWIDINTIQKNIGKNKYTLDNIWKKMNNKNSSGTSLKDE